MAKPKKLPSTVYVVWTEGASDEWFFETTTNIDDVKCAGAEIGVYKLIRTRNFKLVEEKSRLAGQAK